MQQRQILDGHFLPPPRLVMHKKFTEGVCVEREGRRRHGGRRRGRKQLNFGLVQVGSRASWMNECGQRQRVIM